MPSQPTLMPFFSTITGFQARSGVSAGSDEEQALLAQVIQRFEKSDVALVEDMIIRKRDDPDAIEFQGLQHGDGGVELEGLGAARVDRSYGSFKIYEAEVGLAENIGDSSEENVPSAMVIWRSDRCGRGVFGLGGCAGLGS